MPSLGFIGLLARMGKLGFNFNMARKSILGFIWLLALFITLPFLVSKSKDQQCSYDP